MCQLSFLFVSNARMPVRLYRLHFKQSWAYIIDCHCLCHTFTCYVNNHTNSDSRMFILLIEIVLSCCTIIHKSLIVLYLTIRLSKEWHITSYSPMMHLDSLENTDWAILFVQLSKVYEPWSSCYRRRLRSKGQEFESQHGILDYLFFTFISYLIELMFEKTQNKCKEEADNCPFV